LSAFLKDHIPTIEKIMPVTKAKRGLMEMATGQKMTATAEDGRMVRLDKETGEVTLKFKLPGF